MVVLALLAALLVAVGPASARRSHHTTHHRGHSGALPYMGPEPGPSIFGIDTADYDSNQANYDEDIPAARQLGARYDHITLGPKTASGNFRTVDPDVKQARKQHMGVILSFGGIASACSIRPVPANVHACPPTTARDLSNYEAYFRKMLLHYRNVVQYYESWVEPNNSSSWLPGPDAGGYARVLEAEYSEIRSVDSQYGLHLKLLFGSPNGFSIEPGSPGWVAVLPYTELVLDALHGKRPFDGVALHAYRFPPGGYGPSAPAYDYVGGIPAVRGAGGPFPGLGCDSSPWCQMTWPEELSAYEQEFAKHGYGDPPLWLTEFGWPGNVQPDGNYFPSESEQAADVAEAYHDLMQLPFVKAALWFNVRDYQPTYQSPDPAYFYHYGLLDYSFQRKPAAMAFQAMANAHSGR